MSTEISSLSDCCEKVLSKPLDKSERLSVSYCLPATVTTFFHLIFSCHTSSRLPLPLPTPAPLSRTSSGLGRPPHVRLSAALRRARRTLHAGNIRQAVCRRWLPHHLPLPRHDRRQLQLLAAPSTHNIPTVLAVYLCSHRSSCRFK